MAPERVFGEMSDLGLTATEAGPGGYLPKDPAEAADFLASRDLRLVGGFLPLVLHRSEPVLDRAREAAGWLSAAGGAVVVIAAETGTEGYESRPELDDDGWSSLLEHLDEVVRALADDGMLAVLHPHVGTMIERGPQIERVLEGTTVPLCLDTGHQLIGGVDPVQLAHDAGDRIRHAQLKDVDAELARGVRDGRLGYTEAVRRGMFVPLGAGDVDVSALLDHLARTDYDGWLVLEQDVVVAEEPPPDGGPVHDVRSSVQYLSTLLDQLEGVDDDKE